MTTATLTVQPHSLDVLPTRCYNPRKFNLLPSIMKNLIAKITFSVTAFSAAAALFLSYVPMAFAAGGDPYVPHVPVDTGLVSDTIFSTAALITYGIGMLFFVSSKILKGKLLSEIGR